MDFFSCALGRLKHELRVSKDGEVAEILGLSKTAFSERKKRNSFPEKELKDIALKRPELGIDVLYVLTGEREYSRQETQDQFIDRMQAIKATGQIVDALPLSSTEREDHVLPEGHGHAPTGQRARWANMARADDPRCR